ncbi:MAG: outer membrane beta-barrel protein [Bauldia sp.]
MKTLTLTLLSTTALLAAAATAEAADFGRAPPLPYVPPPVAAPVSQNYVSIFGGYGWSQFGNLRGNAYRHEIRNANANNFLSEWATNGKVGDGWLLGVSVGTNLSNNVRGELEASFIRMKTNTSSVYTCDNLGGNNSCNNFNYNGARLNNWAGTTEGGGRIDNIFLMANLWYDFAPGSSWNPYIGGGAGVVHSKGSFKSAFISYQTNNNNTNLPADYLDHNVDAWGLAFQAGAGMRFALMPNMALDVGYRFKAGMNLATSVSTNFPINSLTTDVARWQGSDRLSFGIHTVQVGLTMGF